MRNVASSVASLDFLFLNFYFFPGCIAQIDFVASHTCTASLASTDGRKNSKVKIAFGIERPKGLDFYTAFVIPGLKAPGYQVAD